MATRGYAIEQLTVLEEIERAKAHLKNRREPEMPTEESSFVRTYYERCCDTETERPGRHKEVAGIISERDIIRALSAVGLDCLMQPVSQSMTKKVVTCEETDTLEELMAIMTARRFHHLPVMADDALVGIISIGDIVKHHVAEVVMEATAMREYITHG